MAGSVGQTTVGVFPWQATYGNANFDQRDNNSAYLGMGLLRVTTFSTGNYFENPHYLDSVTWKVSMIFDKDNDKAIMSVLFDGASQGTIDMYAAGASNNNYAEITGIAVATPGSKMVRFATLTKNGSSSNYGAKINSYALIATSGTYSTPGGTDTPGYTWQHIPFMGTKGNTTFGSQGGSRTQNSGYFAGGYLNSAGNQNDEWNTDVWIDSGTGKWAQVFQKNPSHGIYTIKFDGSSIGTIDGYAAGDSANNYTEITGVSVASSGVKNVQVIMATKNGSSGGYYGAQNSVAWIRTGA